MDFRTLTETVPMLIVEGKFQHAERMLQQAYGEAKESSDLETLEHVSALFVQLYSSFEPPQAEKAESFSLERERIKPGAYSRLQTAMVLYHVGHAPKRAAEKLKDAVETGRKERDFPTVYSALSLLGQSLLDVNKTTEAAEVLIDIEQMIAAREPIVVGDETAFLEKAFARDVAKPTVRRIAGMLAPVCRDATFGQCLTALAGSNENSSQK